MFATKILEEKESKFNGNLRVVKTLGMGTYIQAEGLTQSGGIVETIWKQSFRKINKIMPSIQNCLILGLGGGTVAKLIRKKHLDTRIVGVDIDSTMVELGKKYLGLGKLDVQTNIGDAYKFLKETELKFDLIIVDLYQGDKFPGEFSTEGFLRLVKNKLSSQGLAVFNRLYYGEKRPETVKFGRILEKEFSDVIWFYPEANLVYLCTT